MNDKLSEDRLAEIRAAYAGKTGDEAVVVIALLDEIDRLDDLLADSEDEVERLRVKVEPKAVSGSVSRTPNGKWRARWREGDTRHSRIFARRAEADAFLVDAKSRGIGGAR